MDRMIGFVLRILWRILIFILGSLVVWITVFFLFPVVDSRLPAFITLLLVYCLLAYVLIPNLTRLFCLVIKPRHIPLYVTTGDGWPSDPVNIAIITKNRSSLIEAMEAAGWYTAHEMTLRTAFKEFVSIILNKPYPEAPLSSLYLFNKKHAVGFEIPTNRAKSARTRHHVRFWKLEAPKLRSAQHPHMSFWQQKMQHLFGGKNEIWIGAATEEVFPVDVQWYTGRLTHGGSHDADRERDFIIQSLKAAKRVKDLHTTKPGAEVMFRGQQFRTIYVTDGSIKVITLR